MDDAARRLVEKMKPVFEGGAGKIAQHAKYDMLMLERYGVNVAPLVFDPMLADYLLQPHQRGHGLDALALNYLKLKKSRPRN